MREQRRVTREVVGMVPRATCRAELREVVLAVCSIADGRRSCAVRGRCARECHGRGLRSSECAWDVRRVKRLVHAVALARAARVVGHHRRGVG